MGECTCFPTPPSMHTTHYGAIEPASALEPNPECCEHFRKPPHRLIDGTWSDGVDRVECIKLRRPPNKRWQVYQCATGYWEAYAESDGRQLDEIESFDTHTEAIAYADAQARTNQGENK